MAGFAPGGPRPRIRPAAGQHLAPEQVRARPGRGARRFFTGGSVRLGEDLRGQLRQARLGPVRLLRRVRPDLDPVAGHHGQPPQPGRRAGRQHRVKQLLHQPVLRASQLPEPGDGHVIGHVLPARHPERHVIPAPVLDRPRRQPPPPLIGIRQQGQQHHRVIPPPALTRPDRRNQPGGQLRGRHRLYRLDNQPDNMVLRHPIEHIHGQKGGRIPVHRQELTSHKCYSTWENTSTNSATRPLAPRTRAILTRLPGSSAAVRPLTRAMRPGSGGCRRRTARTAPLCPRR